MMAQHTVANDSHTLNSQFSVRQQTWVCTIWLWCVCAIMLIGCAGDGQGKFSIRSLNPQGGELSGGFEQAYYRFDDKHNLTVVLLSGPEEMPTQAATVRLFWKPRAGRTAIDPTATNATIHYMIFAGETQSELGIYSGAGYLFPHQTPGKPKIKCGLWESTLRLTEQSPGFADRLGSAVIEGKFDAVRDDVKVELLLRRLNVMVRERLGRARQVHVSEGGSNQG